MGVVHHADQDPVKRGHRCSRCGVALPAGCTAGLFVEEFDDDAAPDGVGFRPLGGRRASAGLCVV